MPEQVDIVAQRVEAASSSAIDLSHHSVQTNERPSDEVTQTQLLYQSCGHGPLLIRSRRPSTTHFEPKLYEGAQSRSMARPHRTASRPIPPAQA